MIDYSPFWETLNDLCRILSCQISDLVQYIPNEDDQIL